jgi:hypothetical protein
MRSFFRLQLPCVGSVGLQADMCVAQPCVAYQILGGCEAAGRKRHVGSGLATLFVPEGTRVWPKGSLLKASRFKPIMIESHEGEMCTSGWHQMEQWHLGRWQYSPREQAGHQTYHVTIELFANHEEAVDFMLSRVSQ